MIPRSTAARGSRAAPRHLRNPFFGANESRPDASHRMDPRVPSDLVRSVDPPRDRRDRRLDPWRSPVSSGVPWPHPPLASRNPGRREPAQRYFEGRDRSSPSSPGACCALDSAAAVNLARDPRTVLRLGRLSFAIGIGAGLLLVLLTRNLALLLFGIAGAVLAWSYSSPPLQLSYRGVGEVSTFLAFGPIMTVGATVAFGGGGIRDSLFASVVLGFLASAISFARYFPNRVEDSDKGKRTPVTILGFRGARRLFLVLPLLPVPFGIVWSFFGGGVLWILLTLAFWIAIVRAFPKEETASRFDRAIAWTVAAHALVGLAIVAALFFGLSIRRGGNQV